jgi:MoxR-like ATPase
VPYPTAAEEERILMAPSAGTDEPSVPIIGAEHICDLQEVVLAVPVSRYVVAYVAKLVRATRPSDPTATPFIREMVEWGAGPRAGQPWPLRRWPGARPSASTTFAPPPCPS